MWDRCAYRAFTQACTTEKYSKQGAHSKACIAPQYGDVAENVIFNICNYEKKEEKRKEKRLLLEIVSAIDVQYLQELYSFFFFKNISCSSAS